MHKSLCGYVNMSVGGLEAIGFRCLGARVPVGCDPPTGCWKLNFNPLQEQHFCSLVSHLSSPSIKKNSKNQNISVILFYWQAINITKQKHFQILQTMWLL